MISDLVSCTKGTSDATDHSDVTASNLAVCNVFALRNRRAANMMTEGVKREPKSCARRLRAWNNVFESSKIPSTHHPRLLCSILIVTNVRIPTPPLRTAHQAALLSLQYTHHSHLVRGIFFLGIFFFIYFIKDSGTSPSPVWSLSVISYS